MKAKVAHEDEHIGGDGHVAAEGSAAARMFDDIDEGEQPTEKDAVLDPNASSDPLLSG